MNVGQLRNRIIIQKRAEEPVRAGPGTDATGAEQEAWETIGQRWAEVRNIRGSELMAASQLYERAEVKICIRYMPGIRPKEHRVLFKNRVYNILHVDNHKERNEWLYLLCEAVTA